MGKGKIVSKNVALVGSESYSGDGDCHVYAIRYTPGKVCLIDAGVDSGDQIIQNVDDTFGAPIQITHLILTHAHIDHIGAAHQIKARFPDVQIGVHEWDRDTVEGVPGTETLTAASWYGITYAPVHVDRVFKRDEEILIIGEHKLYIFHTPGHTPGSISLTYHTAQDGLILFGQDIHGPFLREFNSNIDDWRKSMKRLLALKADILCEGHYGVITGRENVRQFINSYLNQNPRLS